jgi:hypothetical protein
LIYRNARGILTLLVTAKGLAISAALLTGPEFIVEQIGDNRLTSFPKCIFDMERVNYFVLFARFINGHVIKK